MNRMTLFVGALLLAIVALLLAIYYAIPGVYHVLVSGATPPLSSQPRHVVAFGVLGVLLLLVALINRPRVSRRS
jgi:hypothetical protein